ncbi:MAG: RDD family protein [Candidatus Methanofastidiosia archaeon]
MKEEKARGWRRVLAYLIDVAIVFFLVSFAGGMRGEDVIEEIRPFYSFFNMGVFYGFLWIYFTLFEGYKGQSIGKMILKLEVKKVDGREIGYDDAAIRNFGKSIIIPVLPLDLIFGLGKSGYFKYFDFYTETSVYEVK